MDINSAACVNGFRLSNILVIFTVMAGEYDNQVKWPYVGKTDVELLNKLDDSVKFTFRHVCSCLRRSCITEAKPEV